MAILSEQLKFYKSSSGEGLGGSITGTEIISGDPTNLFDNVSSSESTLGDVEYRCLFIQNKNSTVDLLNAKVFILSNTTSLDTRIEIGLGTSGISTPEQTIPNESTAPSGVTFLSAQDAQNGLNVGNLPSSNGYVAIWVKRTVDSGAEATIADQASIKIVGETTA